MEHRQLPAVLYAVAFLVLAACLPTGRVLAVEAEQSAKGVDFIWIEGESPISSDFDAGGLTGDQGADPSVLSGGAWLAHDGRAKETGASASWSFEAGAEGDYSIYCRKYWYHGPFRWSIDRGDYRRADRVSLLDEVKAGEFACLNWVELGTVHLGAGRHMLSVEMLREAPQGVGTAMWESQGNPYVLGIDCFCLLPSGTAFVPRGKLKPGQSSAEPIAAEGWWAFEPGPDPTLHADPAGRSPIDMRNILGQEPVTRKITSDNGRFYAVDPETGDREEVRFWGVCVSETAVNMPPERVEELAAMLAKRGVNLVRVHAPVTANCASGNPRIVNETYLANLYTFIQKLKAEGIYTALSIYSPDWFRVNAEWGIPGYDAAPFEGTSPYCLLFFDQTMQEIYNTWMERVLTYDPDGDGPRPHLGKDPGLAIWEVCNDDSLLSWHLNPHAADPQIPDVATAPLEARYNEWLAAKYGSVQAAFVAWGSYTVAGDDIPAGKAVLMISWLLSDEGLADVPAATDRALDQTEFLGKVMADFYVARDNAITVISQGCPDTYGGNTYWNPFGCPWSPHDRFGDFALGLMDRHCYWAGTRVRWDSQAQEYRYVDLLNLEPYDDDGEMKPHIAEGDLYRDLLAAEYPELVRVREDEYVGKTHLVSEYCFGMVNRFRTCAALMAAAYGALQGTDGFCFFMVENEKWCHTLGTFPVMTPAVLGQFPAAALAYRRGDIQQGQPTFSRQVSRADKPGSPANKPDPLAYYAGQVQKRYAAVSSALAVDPDTYHDRRNRTVKSLAAPGHQDERQVQMYYGPRRGINDPRPRVLCNTPCFQAATGMIDRAPVGQLDDCWFRTSEKDFYGCFMVVSLDGRPIRDSADILVQVMSEEQTLGFESENDFASGMMKVTAVGTGPVNVKDIGGRIRIENATAAQMQVWALDANGNRDHLVPKVAPLTSVGFDLEKDVLYYQITR